MDNEWRPKANNNNPHQSRSVDSYKEKCRLDDFSLLTKAYLNDEHHVTGEPGATLDNKDSLYFNFDLPLNKIVRMNSEDSLNQEMSSSYDKTDYSGNKSKDCSGKKSSDQFQYEIVQQGPDLQQDSPRSTHSSPKINAGGNNSGNVSMSNSPALQHRNLANNESSPSPPPPTSSSSSFLQQQNQVLLQNHNAFCSTVTQSVATQPSTFNGTPQQISVSQPSAMILGPNSNPGGFYYNSYSQQAPPVSRAPPPYEAQQSTVFYQPFVSAIVPPGAIYYAPNMSPYVVNAHQTMPWIQPTPADYSSMNYQHPPPGTPLVYQPAHVQQPTSTAQHYVQPPYGMMPPHNTPSHQFVNHPPQQRLVDEISNSNVSSKYQKETAAEPEVIFRKNTNKQLENVYLNDKSDIIPSNISKYSDDYHNDRDFTNEEFVHRQGSESGSGTQEIIASTAVTDSPRHSGTNRYHTGAKLELEHGRTPLFGQCPTWWGENEQQNDDDDSQCMSLNIQSEYQRKSSPQFQRKAESASDTEGRSSRKSESSAYQPPKHSCRENIRMDIPFSSIPPLEQEDPSDKRRASGALSFTIDFSPSDEAKKRKSFTKPPVESKAEDQWKMQSAERVHKNFVRRSLRKAGGITAESHPLTAASNAKEVQNKEQELRQTAKDPKAYLLNKMLAAEDAEEQPVKLPKNTTIVVVEDECKQSEISDIRSRKESDAGSDAGTYVVDRDRDQEEELRARLQIDRIFGVECTSRSRSSSSSCERTPSPVSYEEAIINKPRRPPIQQQTSSSSSSKPIYVASKAARPTPVVSQQTSADKEEERRKKGLLKQLLKISQQPTDQRKSYSGSTTTKPADPLAAPRKPILKKQTSTTPVNSGTTQANFARTEHGRLSLRSVSTSGVPPKPPNPLGKPKMSVVKPNSKDAEMSLWLRRKEYNPMKAAAEGRTKKTLPNNNNSSSTVDPPYLSNRSQSFHTGAIMPKASLRKHQSIEDSLAADGSDLEPLSDSVTVANYSRNFAASLNRLSRSVVSDNDASSANRRSTNALDPNSLTSLARLSKELGSHAKDVLNKLQASSANANVSKSVDNVFSCTDEPSEEDSLEHSGPSGITGLVKQLELANQAFEIVDQFLKKQHEESASSTVEPADPASACDQQTFRIRPTRLTKLDANKFSSDTRGRSFSEKEQF